MLVVPEVAAEAGERGGQAPIGQGAVDGEEAIGEVNPHEAVEEGDGGVSYITELAFMIKFEDLGNMVDIP